MRRRLACVWLKKRGQSVPGVRIEREEADQIELDLVGVESLAELGDGRLEVRGGDRADFVVRVDQPVLVRDLQLVEKGAQQCLTAAEVQGHQQRGGQLVVGSYDTHQVADASVH